VRLSPDERIETLPSVSQFPFLWRDSLRPDPLRFLLESFQTSPQIRLPLFPPEDTLDPQRVLRVWQFA